jgi:hypothetical protein
MVSSKIQNLSTEELAYLEKILGAEFARQNAYATQFKSKNGYAPCDNTEKVKKLLSAVRSQKNLTNMPKW